MDSLKSLAVKVSWSVGDPFNMVTNENLMKYTDYALSYSSDQKYDIFDIKHGLTDPLPRNIDEGDSLYPVYLWSNSGEATTMYMSQSTQEEYDESVKANSLFGIPLLSYHSDIATDENGMFWKRHIYGTDTIYRDPLAPDNLMRKGQAIAILSITGVAVVYGSMYGYKYYKNKY